jgi:hypothetical protein
MHLWKLAMDIIYPQWIKENPRQQRPYIYAAKTKSPEMREQIKVFKKRSQTNEQKHK